MKCAALIAWTMLGAACAPPSAAPTRVEAPRVTPPAPRRAAYHRDTPDAPFRAEAPPLAPAEPSQPPPIHTFRLANGLRVILLEQHSSGLLSVGVSAREASHALGADILAARTMWLGISTHSFTEIRAACDADLAQPWSWATTGAMGVGITALADRPEHAISLLGEVATSPSFPAGDVLRILVNDMHERETRSETPKTIAARVLPMALYGWSHPEEEEGSLRSRDVGALSRPDVVNAYENAFDPALATVVAVGDTTEEALHSMLERVFGSWKSRGKRPEVARPPPSVSMASPRLVVVDRPGSSQTVVAFGGPGPAYASADWPPSLVMIQMVAGANGRAVRALRALAVPGVELRLIPTVGTTRVYLSAEVAREQTAASLRELERSLQSMSGADVETEVPEARERMLRLSGEWLMTVNQEISILNNVVGAGASPDFVARLSSLIGEVTPTDVHRVAASYLDPARMKVVVVGDWSQVRAQLQELGWGPIELRDGSGAVVGVEPRAAEGTSPPFPRLRLAAAGAR